MWAFVHPIAVAVRKPQQVAVIARTIPEETVAAIRASTESARACAKRFNVAHTTVVRIRLGQLRAQPGVQRVRVSDDVVEEMRVRHEDAGWTLSQLSKFYGVPKATVQKYLSYRRR